MIKTLVVGASEKSYRYSYRVIQLLKEYDFPVVALGKNRGQVQGVNIDIDFPIKKDIHTVTMYVNPRNQDDTLVNQILALAPQRIIFNPGSENRSFASKAREQGIEVLNECTLVMLRSGQY